MKNFNKKLKDNIKRSKKKTKTGFFRVTKKNNRSDYKNGFCWCYNIREGNKNVGWIYASSLYKLELKVRERGLPWLIVDEDKANISLQEDSIGGIL